MQTEDIDRVADYLDAMNIVYVKSTNSILVDRTSICTQITGAGIDENKSYAILRERLNKAFSSDGAVNGRFIYAAKTDDWLMIDKIP